jgi:hypothetical protein
MSLIGGWVYSFPPVLSFLNRFVDQNYDGYTLDHFFLLGFSYYLRISCPSIRLNIYIVPPAEKGFLRQGLVCDKDKCNIQTSTTLWD